jgi:hypothetical protein
LTENPTPLEEKSPIFSFLNLTGHLTLSSPKIQAFGDDLSHRDQISDI